MLKYKRSDAFSFFFRNFARVFQQWEARLLHLTNTIRRILEKKDNEQN
ncbi:hypothetical protein HMPREF1991_03179 [Hoylesella loescheii DSM 19665 = JCM 12249 = ATCC 15930]|uniref:Uncharacterized protein n=1 Tax=Hoylesella loescheii DSM 19665 = JCM 12249 = ATCC 15930 TaxID=1122985 RepID=A0A069QDM6_HOYLO|nr:hypothetical protein HMPREF1991_03179 [Hoylesella loescheii DSM 19665 = JCM 12249 = ATCC 15930]